MSLLPPIGRSRLPPFTWNSSIIWTHPLYCFPQTLPFPLTLISSMFLILSPLARHTNRKLIPICPLSPTVCFLLSLMILGAFKSMIISSCLILTPICRPLYGLLVLLFPCLSAFCKMLPTLPLTYTCVNAPLRANPPLANLWSPIWKIYTLPIWHWLAPILWVLLPPSLTLKFSGSP